MKHNDAKRQCTHVYLRGVKKGQTCNSVAMAGIDKCCIHKPKKAPVVKSMDMDTLCDGVDNLRGPSHDGPCDDVIDAGVDSQEMSEAEVSMVTVNDMCMRVTDTTWVPNRGESGEGTSVMVLCGDDFAPAASRRVPDNLCINPARDIIYSKREKQGVDRSTVEEIADLLEWITSKPLDKDLSYYTDNHVFGIHANKNDRHDVNLWGYYDIIRKLHRDQGTSIVCMDQNGKAL